MGRPTLQSLWRSTPAADQTFQPQQVSHLPGAVQRYLSHSMAAGTPLATAVHLRMHGEIKLQGWCPFRAEQVIRGDRGLIWQARVGFNGLPVWGSDRLIDGAGSMGWKLLGLFPLITASGPDISRSAAGRLAAESLWLPSRLCQPDVSWSEVSPTQIQAHLTVATEPITLTLTVDDQGRLQQIRLLRWGNPDGGEHHYVEFGGLVTAEASFEGYTLPSALRVGWHCGSDRFESEGEFFRCTLDHAEFR